MKSRQKSELNVNFYKPSLTFKKSSKVTFSKSSTTSLSGIDKQTGINILIQN
jgi:hypothetical protein